MDYTKDDILSLVEGYKKGIVNWRTLEAAVDTLFSSQNSGKPIVMCSVCPDCSAYNKKTDEETTKCWNCGESYRAN